jgi:hypothetical protein
VPLPGHLVEVPGAHPGRERRVRSGAAAAGGAGTAVVEKAHAVIVQ